MSYFYINIIWGFNTILNIIRDFNTILTQSSFYINYKGFKNKQIELLTKLCLDYLII